MRLMGEAERGYVQERLGGLPRGVRLVVFTRGGGCESCEATEQLAREIAEAVPEVRLEVVGEDERERLAAFGVDKLPALALVPEDPAGGPAAGVGGPADGPANGIRFFGFPGGYEFDSLLEAIRRVAESDPGLGGELLQHLIGRTEPLHLQVFVTATCPYCPRMVQLAHRMALASPLVRADMVDAAEFPRLAALYGVQGVPMTVVDGAVTVVGSVPEAKLLAALRQVPRRAAR
jgi:glutaredoxin-like protein